MKNEIHQQFAKDYILGGKAHVVFFNETTQVQKRFIIYAEYKKNDANPYAPIEKKRENVEYWKVFDMDAKPRKFLGKIAHSGIGNNDTPFWPEKEKNRNEYLLMAANFQHVWKKILDHTLEPNIHILHLGSCSVCSRPLTDAISLTRGIGPICWKNLYSPFKSQL